MERFKNKYRTTSHRMPQWDYSSNGIYFITIVTQDRECNLGKIVVSNVSCNSSGSNDSHGSHVETHGRASLQPHKTHKTHKPHKPHHIQLSDFGKIVNNEWIKSFEIRDELFLDTHIIMPNHIHVIVILDKPYITKTNATQSPQQSTVKSPDQSTLPTFIRKFKSISSFIAGFKSAVNSKIDDFIDNKNLNIPKYNRNNHFFQPNYHDHIVRNNEEYQRIKDYIINNPVNWINDKFNPEIKNNYNSDQ